MDRDLVLVCLRVERVSSLCPTFLAEYAWRSRRRPSASSRPTGPVTACKPLRESPIAHSAADRRSAKAAFSLRL